MSAAAAPCESDDMVRTRRIYYFSGFDPRGAAHYHRLYRDEASKQAAHLGASVEVGPRIRRAVHQHCWTVKANWPTHAVSTEYHFLGWDDIVRRHWEPNILRLLVSSISSYADYIRCGAFGGIRRHFRGPFLSAVYPFSYLAGLLLLALLCAMAVGRLIQNFTSSTMLGGAASALVAGILCAGGTWLANRMGVFWLLRTYLFVHGWGKSGMEAMNRRVGEFARLILREQQACPCDEVLIVGHSVGSIVAVSVAAQIAQLSAVERRRNMTLVTLGHCIPLLSLMPSAQAFRKNLQVFVHDSGMRWLDMIARADALCFSQADLLDICGIVGSPVNAPIAQVVRPFQMFDAKTYARIKRNKLRLHFQYLMASDLPNDYDYFRITAGPYRLMPFDRAGCA